MEEWLFFDNLREIILWTTPVAFLMGLTLLVYKNYNKFETLMGREYGLRKRILPKIETNIFSFHEWCLRKRTILGLVCIIYAVVVFSLLRRADSLNEVIGEVY